MSGMAPFFQCGLRYEDCLEGNEPATKRKKDPNHFGRQAKDVFPKIGGKGNSNA
jgi:hypothetical protein